MLVLPTGIHASPVVAACRHLDMADARRPLPCANWVRGIDMQFATLHMASSFISCGIEGLDSHSHMYKVAQGQQSWIGLHVFRTKKNFRALSRPARHHHRAPGLPDLGTGQARVTGIAY